MAPLLPAPASRDFASRDSAPRVKAVLGPTNTGKTHLAIERLCAHSSGIIGFPLRLLAREVYDRVRAIKGDDRVALITGEERIEPANARWLLCTAEAMPMTARDYAFVALDEAQLGADRERGHVFTDRLLHARGREETMLLGSATIAPLVRALVPGVEIVARPRFSTLSHVGARKLSRLPPRSAIVAFSAERVYAIAEMLRRFRGGAAVVMGAMSPATRNRQVALFQSREVDYIVATDAIGMGLNLDVEHVAFAGLGKFDGARQRRLLPAEMAQIAGRAGRHQRDGSFGTLSGAGFADGAGNDAAFTDEEVDAIEQHRFAPLTGLYWRDADPRRDSLAGLIADLEASPALPELRSAPEAIDLAVLKRLAGEAEIAATTRGRGAVTRFWEVCRLPDFRQQGSEFHARFVARLWQDLRAGALGADYVAQAIAQLDHTSGDIDTLQGRIAAIRSWSYIAQRPDWVTARDEMAARARAVEARLSDALHARLTERFVNRRTTVLLRKLGADSGLLAVRLAGDEVFVEDEHIGTLRGFSFVVDPLARIEDRKLLLAAAERHLPKLLGARARDLAATIATPDGSEPGLVLAHGVIRTATCVLARLAGGRGTLTPRLVLDPALESIPAADRAVLARALDDWLAARLAPLAPLRRIEEASTDLAAGPELRALLIRLVEAGGVLGREGSGLDRLTAPQRARLARLGLSVGTLDLFVPALLRPAARAAWDALVAADEPAGAWSAMPPVIVGAPAAMPPVIVSERAPRGYRGLGAQALRVDLAERLLREAHAARAGRGRRTFALDPARAVSIGLTTASYARLLRLGGFTAIAPRALAPGAYGPPAPVVWRWSALPRPAPHPRRAPVPCVRAADPPATGAFAALLRLLG